MRLITREELQQQLLHYLESDMDDDRLAWLASMFLDGHYRVVGDGVFEQRGGRDEQGGSPAADD
jgi:hypothetical protein